METTAGCMDKKVYEKYRTLIYQASGIALNDNKEALVSARVAKRIRALGLIDHRDYLRYVQDDHSGEEIVQLLDVISTNVTNFFRESHHFDLLTDCMKQWLSRKQTRFRFWSAGCSSGEEPYTMAMVLREATGNANTEIKILATDISTRILGMSMRGSYDAKKMDGVPAALRERYFDKEGRMDDAVYTAGSELKNMILFKRLNLSVTPFPMNGPMDVIFCRNVMIYFDNRVRVNLLNEFKRLLKPGGYLMVGHAESLAGMLSGFKPGGASVYVKD